MFLLYYSTEKEVVTCKEVHLVVKYKYMLLNIKEQQKFTNEMTNITLGCKDPEIKRHGRPTHHKSGCDLSMDFEQFTLVSYYIHKTGIIWITYYHNPFDLRDE